MLLHLDNSYNIRHLRGRASACRTHLPSNTAFRGFGVPQGVLVVENLLEDVAAMLQLPAHLVRAAYVPRCLRRSPLTQTSSSGP